MTDCSPHCPICDEPDPPWWPSQLQGEPWRHISFYALPGATAKDADDNAGQLAAMHCRTYQSTTVETMPCEGELWAQALGEMRRRYAMDTDGTTIGDDGCMTFPSGAVLWLRMLRYAPKPRVITNFTMTEISMLPDGSLGVGGYEKRDPLVLVSASPMVTRGAVEQSIRDGLKRVADDDYYADVRAKR